jgi:hypothetical protein
VKAKTILSAKTLLQVLSAAHLTYKVESPYNRRGGILLVSPAGHGKSSFLRRLEGEMPKTLMLSDLTTRQLSALRATIVEGKVQTLILDELEKIYQRKEETAANLEGNICALVEQGFSDLPGDRPSNRGIPAQALVIANCTEEFFVKQQKNWSSAFLRRFLVCLYRLENPDIFADYIEKWDLVRFGEGMFFDVPLEPLPYSLAIEEAKQLRRWILFGEQDDKTPFQLLQKIACVLRWKFRVRKTKDETMLILREFSACLMKKGAILKHEKI